MLEPRFLLALAFPAPISAALLTVGPGGDFAEIQDAVAASRPGDTILVQPGTYEAFAVPHALRVLGAGSGDVVISTFGGNGVVVSGIAAGEEVVISGLEVAANPISASVQASILLDANAGGVVLHDVVIDHDLSGVGVHAEQCARVVLLDCAVLGAGDTGGTTPTAAVRAPGSTLWIAGSTITADTTPTGFAQPGDHAVSIANGALHVWRSTLRGGDGANGKGLFVPTPGGDGVHAEAAEVVLYGGPAGDAIQGGDGAFALFGPPHEGGAGLRLLAGSAARVQADLALAGGLDATGLVTTPPIVADASSSAQLDPRVFATLAASAAQATLGRSFDVDVDGHALAPCATFVALDPGPTLAVAGVEGLGFLDPTLFLQLPPLVLDPTGTAHLPIAVPPLAPLLGTTLIFQSVEVAAGEATITNPALVAVTG